MDLRALFFDFAIGFLTFISSCGFGFMQMRAPISFLAKVKLLPGVLFDFIANIPTSIRVIVTLYQKLGRPPSKEEYLESLFEALQGSRLFREEQATFYRTVGLIAVTWANLEYFLDLLIAVCLTRAGGDTFASQLPQSLKFKLALFKRCFEKLESLKQFREEALSIHSDLIELKEFRHDVVHGIASNRLASGSREIFRHSYEGSKLLKSVRLYSLSEMMDKNAEIFSIVRRLFDLLSAIDAVLPKDMIDNSGG